MTKIKNVYILGPYNSGTNLLQNIFEPINGHSEEVGSKIGNFSGKYLNLKDIYKPNKKGVLSCNKHPYIGGYKHSNELLRLIPKIIKSDSLYIICYRYIFSWIISTKKAHYKIKKLYNGYLYNNKIYPKLSSIYIDYYKMYLKLLKRYDNFIFINYSKLISPNGLEYLNDKLKPFSITIDKTHFNKVLNKPSKYHGKSVSNSLTALKKDQYIREKYNNRYPSYFEYYEKD